MNTIKKIRQMAVVISVSCIFLASFTYAEVPFTWMKGTSVITQEDLINGMLWADQIVEMMYRYGNPDHATIKFIKELFYLQWDNVSFRPTISKSKPASYWDEQIVGAVNAAITVYRTSEAVENEKDAQLTQSLETIMAPQRDAMKQVQAEISARAGKLKEIATDIAEQNKAILALIRQMQRKKPTTSQEAAEQVAGIEELEEKQKFFYRQERSIGRGAQ